MEYGTEHSLTIKFSNGDEFKEVDMFLSILEKCNKEASKSGYKKLFSKDESMFVKGLWEEFAGDE